MPNQRQISSLQTKYRFTPVALRGIINVFHLENYVGAVSIFVDSIMAAL
jgi:hypothetical protein